MKLSDEIPGETQIQFERRVEAFYKYKFERHEQWILHNDKLIVCHPERVPLIIHPNGHIEELSWPV